MTTILIKKKDTAGAPAPGDLTNAAGGTEIAVNTATKRIYTKDSGGNVVELGTNSTSSTIDQLTVVTSTTLSYGTANQVQYLNASKLLVGSSNLTFNGTTLTANTIGAFTLSGTIAGGGNQINNVIIGTTTPLAGAFTTVTASGMISSTGTGTANGIRVGGTTVTTALYDDGSGTVYLDTTLGSNTNIPLYIRTKGTGTLIIQPGGSTVGTFSSTGLAVTGTISASAASGAFTGLQVGTSNGVNSGLIIGNKSSGTGAIWSTSITPSATNYAFHSDGSQVAINASTSATLNVANSIVAYATSTGLTVYGTSTIYKAAGLNTVTELLILDPESGTHVGGKGSKITFKDISVYNTGAAIEQARIGVSTGSTLSFRLRDAATAQMILTDTQTGSISLAVNGTIQTTGFVMSSNGSDLVTTRSAGDVYAQAYLLKKSRGTVGTPTTVNNGDAIGVLYFQPYVSSSGYLFSASIQAKVNGAVTSTSAPTDIIISTGSTGEVEAMRILGSNQYVGIKASSPTNMLDVSGSIGKRYTSNVTVTNNNTSTAVLNPFNGQNFSDWLGTNFSTGGPCTGTISITWDTGGSASSAIFSFAKHSGFNGANITLMSSTNYNGDTTTDGSYIYLRNNGSSSITPVFSVLLTTQ